jgi:hypothetical protein
MTAYVYRNIKSIAARNQSLLPGVVFEFMTVRCGLPLFVFDRDELGPQEGWLIERAAKGMIGTDLRSRSLYVVLADGTCSALPIQVVPVEHQFPEPQEEESQVA